MLRKIRRIAAVLFFVLLTGLFLDFTGTLHWWFGWLAKVQFVPAILAHSAVFIAVPVLLTLVFGRIYCSVLCPLGVLQDGISHLSGRRKGKKARFSYAKAKPWLRYGMLALFVAALVAGVGVVASLLDPYAAYGRMAANFFAPLFRLGNNLLAWFAEKADSYAFYSTEVWIKGWITFGVAAVTLAVVGVLAWRNGRTYCNTLCPVGTLLGFASRFSLFAPVFDAETCNRCGRCERNCKASCVDSKNLSIDRSRCVACFNCVEKCRSGAMKYTLRGRKQAEKQTEKTTAPEPETAKQGMSRRGFLSLTGFLAAGFVARAQQLHVDGGFAEIEDKKIPDRKTPVVPPGAQGIGHLKQHCTACQLCVSACPNGVLRPSAKLATLMQPEMSFERGYCRPECTECAQVCPAGAIRPITPADKAGLSIGQAAWIRENCIVLTDELPCTVCERHCPTNAIALVAIDPENDKSLKTPVVNKELCIGCGACEYLCPARPFSAIYVEGNLRHHAV